MGIFAFFMVVLLLVGIISLIVHLVGKGVTSKIVSISAFVLAALMFLIVLLEKKVKESI